MSDGRLLHLATVLVQALFILKLFGFCTANVAQRGMCRHEHDKPGSCERQAYGVLCDSHADCDRSSA